MIYLAGTLRLNDNQVGVGGYGAGVQSVAGRAVAGAPDKRGQAGSDGRFSGYVRRTRR